ncbi:uncharacterized protein LOC130894814 isoform X2 [Diorhabda carinulata]|uniref:uncharacterized protein LOC130894814 isoform X2 n=1 Tax=Diorhabda carinulata TaxID=1163345 RepID=UPI0025A08312|nr:uncharacterized protein LOC130894814 isoform X2 [Diorhabda carinulata]
MDSAKIDSLLKDIKRQFKESDKELSQAVAEEFQIIEDVSLIQNKCDLICNDLRKLRTNMDERLVLMNKNDFIMNILNYKLYEIQYDFSKTIKRLKEKKKELENTEVNRTNESKIALTFIENEKEINECELTHEEQHKSVRQQMLEAQEGYEKSANILDDCLEVMNKTFSNLITLIEAHKRCSSDSTIEETIELDQLKEMLDECRKLQSTGWRTQVQDLTDFTANQGLRFNEEGLLVTESGREISYDEAVEIKLLDNLKLIDLVFPKRIQKVKVDELSLQLSQVSSESIESKMSSEDVNYLKDHLGTPLTLALAEITAVQPRDPIHYLGHWLFKYRYNEEIEEIKKIEINQLTEERERIAKERWHKFIEEEARAAVLEMIVRAEETAIRNELLRIERENQQAEEHEEQLDIENRDLMKNMI